MLADRRGVAAKLTCLGSRRLLLKSPRFERLPAATAALTFVVLSKDLLDTTCHSFHRPKLRHLPTSVLRTDARNWTGCPRLKTTIRLARPYNDHENFIDNFWFYRKE